MSLGRLHVIVDVAPGAQGEELLEEVLGAGATVVQLRVKGVDDRRRLEITSRFVGRCALAGATSIVNDRADLALAAGAGGWHGGAQDLPVATARRLLGPDAVVGGTARDPDAAQRLEREGASYLGVGPVYTSTTKAGLPAPIGLEGLAAVTSAVSIPVVAISGIDAGRVPDVLSAGAHGVAVIGAVRDAPDPAASVRDLLDALESARG